MQQLFRPQAINIQVHLYDAARAHEETKSISSVTDSNYGPIFVSLLYFVAQIMCKMPLFLCVFRFPHLCPGIRLFLYFCLC